MDQSRHVCRVEAAGNPGNDPHRLVDRRPTLVTARPPGQITPIDKLVDQEVFIVLGDPAIEHLDDVVRFKDRYGRAPEAPSSP